MKKKLITVILALVGATAIAQVADYDTNRGFIHPGGLYTQADYKMAGPYEVVARDGQYRHSKGGSERDMKAALVRA